MKPLDISNPIVIPATTEATSAYRVEQSKRNMGREGLKPAFRGKAGDVFKRGVKLEVERCIMTTPLDGWQPPTDHTSLQKMVHAKVRDRVDKEFSDKGLAGFIAITDTTAGVTEDITYDENEAIVKPLIEHPDSGGDSHE